MAEKTYLITGGFGLIGSNLVNRLDGYIRILSRSRKTESRVSRTDIDIRVKDLKKISKNDVTGIDRIYHCASTVDNYNILTDPLIHL